MLENIFQEAALLGLEVLPSTGETSNIPMVIGLFAAALVLFILVIVLRRKQK
ncbi:MAG: LPXTG cell wall anchor domain-containing protein [Eubacteriales bacterium]|nr:LPXTG cell wall anchor domain-containing protein [Eubacteriales bacterium]